MVLFVIGWVNLGLIVLVSKDNILRSPRPQSDKDDVRVPLPAWRDNAGHQCSIPPQVQFMGPSTPTRISQSRKRRRIAFLLLEYEVVTFPRLWSLYFRAADPMDYVLYVCIQHSQVATVMGYDEYLRAYSKDNRLSGLSANLSITVFPPNNMTKYMNVMPTILDVWSHALLDDTILGILYLSGACVPLKSFTDVHRTIMGLPNLDRSILNFAHASRLKQSMWSYHSIRAIGNLLPYREEMTDVNMCREITQSKNERTQGGTEELCPAWHMHRLNLPTQHGIVTFDCWSSSKLRNFTDLKLLRKRPAKAPLSITATDKSLMDHLFESGAFFARKFEPDATIADLVDTTVEEYIAKVVLGGSLEPRSRDMVRRRSSAPKGPKITESVILLPRGGTIKQNTVQQVKRQAPRI